MRLIDVDAVIKVIDEHTFDTDDGVCLDDDITCILEEVPSAEPKNGMWIPHCEMSREYIGSILAYIGYEYWFCDACGYRVEKGRPMYSFCPNCGARMEAKDE